MASKDIKLTNKIMKRVISFERRRSIKVLIQILGIILFSFSVSIFLLYLTAKDALEQGTFELLTLFGEDFEIIKTYWKDTLSIFWEELPQEKLILGVIFLVLGILIIFIFRKRIRKIIRKLNTLAKTEF